jgi:hypothetical protein
LVVHPCQIRPIIVSSPFISDLPITPSEDSSPPWYSRVADAPKAPVTEGLALDPPRHDPLRMDADQRDRSVERPPRPRISTPRGLHGGSTSSMTTAAGPVRRTSRYFLVRWRLWPPMSIVLWSMLYVQPTGATWGVPSCPRSPSGPDDAPPAGSSAPGGEHAHVSPSSRPSDLLPSVLGTRSRARRTPATATAAAARNPA